MITIQGIMNKDKELLDQMWKLPDLDQYKEWASALSFPSQYRAKLLQELVILASLDELIQNEEDCKVSLDFLK
jgi:hypothetical protein